MPVTPTKRPRSAQQGETRHDLARHGDGGWSRIFTARMRRPNTSPRRTAKGVVYFPVSNPEQLSTGEG